MSVAASVPVLAATMPVTMRMASSSRTDRRWAITVLVHSRSLWTVGVPGMHPRSAAAMPGEHVLERHEDRLVGGPRPQLVEVDLELRAPGGDERLLLAAEVVVEGPDGDVGGRRDVIGGDGVQAPVEGEEQHGAC